MRPALTFRVAQLLASCVVLGVGVGLLLRTALGSDGYSTFVNGASLALHVPFVAVNCALGVVLVSLAWVRGLRPGIGTVVQPVLVGLVVSATLEVVPAPSGLPVRFAVLVAAFVVVAVGVAGYLGSATGAGPTEAAALAFDPPIPFRWSYSIVQGAGALTGWLMGAAIGPGTVLVIVLLGPAVDLASRAQERWQVPAIPHAASSAGRHSDENMCASTTETPSSRGAASAKGPHS